jgi:hypothetical protein
MALLAGAACLPGDDGSRAARVKVPSEARAIPVRAHPDLVESSAAVASPGQPGIIFTINDSGHEPRLFALDTAGNARGAWTLAGATNVDWEAMAAGPCAAPGDSAGDTARACLYIGDVGDNSERRRERAVYRVVEPSATAPDTDATIPATRLRFRYADGPHDVEAMYVAPDGALVLITKRRRVSGTGQPRPALVFRLPAAAWANDGLAVAQLVDSLPIVPGSARGRTITDAALAPGARRLAVRTYAEVYVFETDSGTGLVRPGLSPVVCTVRTGRWTGEGVTWLGDRLLLTQEGRRAPMHLIRCP